MPAGSRPAGHDPGMPTLPPNDLEGTVEDFTDADWKEAAEARHPGGFDHFSGDGDGEATLVSRSLGNEKLRGCLRFAVGYQAIDTSSPGNVRLCRKLPLRHPRWNELVCTNASCRPFAPPNTDTSYPSPSTLLKRYVANAPQVPTFSGFTDYSLAEVSLRFEGVDYELVNDADLINYNPGAGYAIRPEWQRMTSVDTTPRVEQLSLEGFQLLYAEGAGAPSPYSNPQGKEFPAPFAQLLVKTDVNFTTRRLPQNFLFASGSYLPRNILAGLGKVSRYDWNGYAAGTLLFLVAKLERKRWTLKTDSEDRWLWSATCGFSYFDPTKGFTGGSPTQITTGLGHNNMPWRGSLVSGDLNAGKWFAATRTGVAGDPGLVETFDIGQLWNAVGNPLTL